MSKIIPNGAAIERSRILAGMTAKQIAQTAGIPCSSVTRAEKGLGVTVTTAAGICAALGKEFDELFSIHRPGGTDNPPAEKGA